MKTRLISSVGALFKLISTSVTFFWAVHFVDIGLKGWEIGAIMAAGSITGIVFITVGGILNDRIKSKSLISVAILMIIIQYLAVSQTDQFVTILMLFVLGGLAGSLYSISMDSLVLKTSKGENQSEEIGLFLSLGYIGISIGMILGGHMLDKVDFNYLLRILAMGFSIILFISFLLPKTPIDKPQLVEYKSDILRKEVLFFILMIFLFALHFGAEGTAYGPFLRFNLGLSMGQMGLYMGGAVGVMAISVVIFSKLIKKTSNIKWILYFGLLGSGVGFIAMSITDNVSLSFLARVLHEIADSAMFVFLYHGLSKFFPVERLGGNTSIVTLTTMVAGALSSIAFGYIGEKMGYEVPLIASGTICVLAVFIAIYQRHLIAHHV
ncbi:MAG: MFS transporter [Patescibacteria group bacterium]|nr:MFS transporter [Patescibacteria group bacterium]